MRSNILFYTDLDLSIIVVQRMEPALHQKSPLDAECRNQEVESHGTKAIALQESHEKAKAHEDHDMNVLKTCRKMKKSIINIVMIIRNPPNRKRCYKGCKQTVRTEKPIPVQNLNHFFETMTSFRIFQDLKNQNHNLQ